MYYEVLIPQIHKSPPIHKISKLRKSKISREELTISGLPEGEP